MRACWPALAVRSILRSTGDRRRYGGGNTRRYVQAFHPATYFTSVASDNQKGSQNFSDMEVDRLENPRMESLPPGANNLYFEPSPYLQQHAFNPVMWRAWNAESLAEASSLGRPIFLSSGYSTCHWCHVMERDSFRDPSVASLLNTNFIPIKLDRELRPDVDGVYMAFLTATEGRGGWPMSVFLTPSLQPFYAGTFYPRNALLALLKRVAGVWVDPAERALMEAGAQAMMATLKKEVEGYEGSGEKDTVGPPQSPLALLTDLSSVSLDTSTRALVRRFDPVWGGFGSAPKFPRPTELTMLLTYAVVTAAHGVSPSAPDPVPSRRASVPFMITRDMRAQLRALGLSDEEVRRMTPAQAHAALQQGTGERVVSVPPQPLPLLELESRIGATGLRWGGTLDLARLEGNPPAALPNGNVPVVAPSVALLAAWYTLLRMACGGIHDALGGGWHRYSTDDRWAVPHFEKMMYDQAAMLKALCEAYVVCGDPALAKAGQSTVSYVLRDMTTPDGGVHAAEDADSEEWGERKRGRAPWAAEWGCQGDAMSVEGAFYTWTAEEVHDALAEVPPQSLPEGMTHDTLERLVRLHWSVGTPGGEEGNCGSNPSTDPHGNLYGLNLLLQRADIPRTARDMGGRSDGGQHAEVSAVARALDTACVALLHARNRRPRPARDTKVITALNGQWLASLSRAAVTISMPNEVRQQLLGGVGNGNGGQGLDAAVSLYRAMLADAERVAVCAWSSLTIPSPPSHPSHVYGDEGALPPFLHEHEEGRGPGTDLARISHRQRGMAHTPDRGFLEDYAHLIAGLLGLYSVGGPQVGYALGWARALQARADADFWVPHSEGPGLGTGAYACTRGDDPSILIRDTPFKDGAEPSPNSVMLGNLCALSALTQGDDEGASHAYAQRAHALTRRFRALLHSSGQNAAMSPSMCVALDSARALEEGAHAIVHLNWSSASVKGGSDSAAIHLLLAASASLNHARVFRHHTLPPPSSPATLQVCRGTTCGLPTADPVQAFLAAQYKHGHDHTPGVVSSARPQSHT